MNKCNKDLSKLSYPLKMYKQINVGHFLDLSQSSGWSTLTWLLVTSKTDHIQILLWAIWTVDLAAYNVVDEQNGNGQCSCSLFDTAAQSEKKHVLVKYKHTVMLVYMWAHI